MTALDVNHCGGCHCGDVRFEVQAPADLTVYACNCSICNMTGFQHLIVPATSFRLLSDEAAVTCYTFGTGIAKHNFCRRCGVKSYYVPRSNPDGFSINVNCLNPATISSIDVLPFDGANWERNAEQLASLSQPKID